MNNVHTTWCTHFIKYKDKNYDISRIYDLSNHTKVPIKKRNIITTSKVGLFYRKCSLLSVL